MRKFGLIGHSLEHSFSRTYFKQKFAREQIDASYVNCEFEELKDLKWMKNLGFTGCNVTMPYKATVLDLVDKVNETAAKVKAINTIKREGNTLIGYNTDVIGFEQSLVATKHWDQIKHRALILGSGGAARAVEYVLNKLDFSTAIVSRSKGDMTYDDVDDSVLKSIGLIVNTTPLGMYPDVNNCPQLPYKYFSERHLVFDLIYNPKKTVFLRKAEENGASVVNGLEMLELQAEASWKIWNNK